MEKKVCDWCKKEGSKNEMVQEGTVFLTVDKDTHYHPNCLSEKTNYLRDKGVC
ncbi:hypothetical protein ACI7MO_09160 [Bacillus paranthracis]|uniref:hypothetical protein n=1 Tax=Bacillus cereus group TaxID=86661 RepID=UPI000ACCC814|nr:hypothetical protein [Bacillus anthracis]